nr:hypothetical protein [Tanacetum cinerariifolium]
RTDADLSAAVQNALQTLLPQIHVEIRKEFRTSSGPSDAAFPLTCWVPRGNCWHRGGAGEELSVGSSQVYPKSSHVHVIYGCGSGRGVVIGISRPPSRVVTGATVIIMTVMDLTGVVVMTTTAAVATTTTLAVTTG